MHSFSSHCASLSSHAKRRVLFGFLKIHFDAFPLGALLHFQFIMQLYALSSNFVKAILLKYFGEILSFDNIGILVSTTDFYLTQKFHSPRKKTQIIVDVTKYHELIIDITIS